MAKNKKETPAAVKKPAGGKKKKYSLTVWDHHDTMIVNLRMWVEKAIENLNADIKKHTPGLVGKPKLEAALSKAQELNVQLWDQIRVAQELADAHKEA
ncbi:MAG: hypothetical protein EBR40_03160 [Proteobacteria bacterium]|nr:hypothetical protein [Pseudomonadota bacterium]